MFKIIKSKQLIVVIYIIKTLTFSFFIVRKNVRDQKIILQYAPKFARPHVARTQRSLKMKPALSVFSPETRLILNFRDIFYSVFRTKEVALSSITINIGQLSHGP